MKTSKLKIMILTYIINKINKKNINNSKYKRLSIKK